MTFQLTGIASQGAGWQAAGRNRVTADWKIWETDPNFDWMADAAILRARAWDVFRNDPVASAQHQAKIVGTHGSKGLVYRSLFKSGEGDDASAGDSEIRSKIEAVIKRYNCGFQVDAGGSLSRVEFEKSIDSLATVAGEGFALRCWIPNRKRTEFATCWKLVRPERVSNPPGMTDSQFLYQGIELDENGSPTAIWIGPPRRLGYSFKASDWSRVPWIGDDGTPNVIRRTGLRVPGMFRSVTMYAPILMMSQQVKKCLDAYVVAKRIQACHPIFIQCADPIEAAKGDRNGAVYGPNTVIEPGKTYYLPLGMEVVIPAWSFNGQDMKDFLDTLYRNEFASWGLPIDVVLAQLGDTNMAASRSAWQQYYRQCEIWQDEHIAQVSSIIDECAIREAVARGELPAGVLTSRGLACRYIRPARAMPDPLKEAQAVALWTTLKRDKTGLWAESGVDYDESIMQRSEDDKFAEAQGVSADDPMPNGDQKPPADTQKPAENGDPKGNDDSQPA